MHCLYWDICQVLIMELLSLFGLLFITAGAYGMFILLLNNLFPYYLDMKCHAYIRALHVLIQDMQLKVYVHHLMLSVKFNKNSDGENRFSGKFYVDFKSQIFFFQ